MTPAQAAADSNVIWLNQQAAWLANAGVTTIKLPAAATGIAAYIAQSDLVGAGYVSTIRDDVYSALYPSAQFPIRSQIMAAMATDLSNLLQGKPIADVNYDTQWLSQQAVFYSTLPPIIDMLNNVAAGLSQPAYSFAGADGYTAMIVNASTALATLLQLGNAPTYFNTISERMLTLAAATPTPAPVPIPIPPQGGGPFVPPGSPKPSPGPIVNPVGSSGGTTTTTTSGTTASSNTGLYVAIAAAAASIGGWWYLRKKHLAMGKNQ
jgi:hypothetical protein